MIILTFLLLVVLIFGNKMLKEGKFQPGGFH
jgi:hypothetical protein